MPNVAFIRPELKVLLSQYELIEDAIAGEKQIKFRKTKYLPQPNAEDTSKSNLARYTSYLERAVFYGVTQRTLLGLVGQVFSKDPVYEIPSAMDIIVEDANGGGVSLVQLAKRAMGYNLSLGRGGIFIDYPTVEDNGASRAQIEAGDIRPTINVYKAQKIINWRTKQRGAKTLLSLVVLEEEYVSFDDGFEMKKDLQWRVLRLTEEDKYEVTIWRKGAQTVNGLTGIYKVVQGPFYPKDSKGVNLNEIPFTFFGVQNNDEKPDLPPLYDLASLNIAHYRNSADYEESCFIVGQPTPYFAGLTQDWVENVLKGTIALGARGAVPLPENGSAGLLQAEANTMPKEAMEQKERQMVALGAKLVEQKTVQRTATEAGLEDAFETSTLVSSAKNVSAALEFALEWCAVYMGIDEKKVKYQLQTDFAIARMTPEERSELIKEWQSNAISFTEMRNVLRKVGVATLDDVAAQNEIAQEIATASQNAIDEAAAIADAAGNNINPTAK